jgi:hypothetical protein
MDFSVSPQVWYLLTGDYVLLAINETPAKCVNKVMGLILQYENWEHYGAVTRYEMTAISLLYLQSKFELGSTNTCGSVVVRADVNLATASQKWRTIISSNAMQSNLVSCWGRALTIPTNRSTKCAAMIVYHLLKYLGVTKTL